MLEEMRHTTEKLRQIFWEQEKKIEYLKRELNQIEETQRQKAKEQAELTSQLNELESALKQRKMELAVEKDNETQILGHQQDLVDRSRELQDDIAKLEDQQRKVSKNLKRFRQKFFKSFAFSDLEISNFMAF